MSLTRANARGCGYRVEELGEKADHVHLILALSPTVQLSKLIKRNLKE